MSGHRMMRNKLDLLCSGSRGRLRDPSLLCTQSACHYGQWATRSATPASSDDRSVSHLPGFVQQVDRFL
ncbi:hypothetical protein TNCV_1533841 [Trichonephila clavipes]|nr:hypothetical protein TNCV_1533841 [Trichonephila clavipes]